MSTMLYTLCRYMFRVPKKFARPATLASTIPLLSWMAPEELHQKKIFSPDKSYYYALTSSTSRDNSVKNELWAFNSILGLIVARQGVVKGKKICGLFRVRVSPLNETTACGGLEPEHVIYFFFFSNSNSCGEWLL